MLTTVITIYVQIRALMPTVQADCKTTTVALIYFNHVKNFTESKLCIIAAKQAIQKRSWQTNLCLNGKDWTEYSETQPQLCN